MAACETTKEDIWLLQLLKQIWFLSDDPSEILCDNQSAIRLIHNPEHHQRTKHIAIRFHFIREKQASGEVNVKDINTKEQLADIFTKPLESVHFKRSPLFPSYSILVRPTRSCLWLLLSSARAMDEDEGDDSSDVDGLDAVMRFWKRKSISCSAPVRLTPPSTKQLTGSYINQLFSPHERASLLTNSLSHLL